MLEYAPMLHVSYYAQNYAGIIHQGLEWDHKNGLVWGTVSLIVHSVCK